MQETTDLRGSGGDVPARTVRLALAAVFLHLAVHAAHGVVHELIPVRIAAWQTAFVVVAVFSLPIVGAALLVRGPRRVGAALFLVGGLASLGFEVAYHFLIDNPDHVGAVESGTTAFAATAVLAAAGALLLVAVGSWLLLAHRHGGSTRSAIESST